MPVLTVELVMAVAGLSLLALSRSGSSWPSGIGGGGDGDATDGDDAVVGSVVLAAAGAGLLLLALFRAQAYKARAETAAGQQQGEGNAPTTAPTAVSRAGDAAAAAHPAECAAQAGSAAGPARRKASGSSGSGGGGGKTVRDIEDLGQARDNLHTAAAAREKRLQRRAKLRAKKSLIPLTLEQMKEKAVVPLSEAARVAKLAELNALEHRPFRATVEAKGGGAPASELLARVPTVVFQLNIGLYCNQACEHCHVDSSPKRKEMMSRTVADQCLAIMRRSPSVQVVDITGGAPELNAQFRYLVSEARKLGKEVLDRCNLTVLLEPHQEDLPEFLATHQVHVIASLPCYLEDNVDGQRGDQVFQRSIEGLQRLNAQGYGRAGSGLVLDLVYNPTGFGLPPAASKLEGAYKRELQSKFGIVFNKLICITNMPINRFYDHLKREGQLGAYMDTLVNAYNPTAVRGLMCKSYVSVDYDGKIFDCDFNQQVDLHPGRRKTLSVFDIERTDDLQAVPIATGLHCYGCTAGEGSS